MKKILSVVLVLALAFAGCGKTEQAPTAPVQTETPITKTETTSVTIEPTETVVENSVYEGLQCK